MQAATAGGLVKAARWRKLDKRRGGRIRRSTANGGDTYPYLHLITFHDPTNSSKDVTLTAFGNIFLRICIQSKSDEGSPQNPQFFLDMIQT